MRDPEALELLWQRFLSGEALPDADSRELLDALKSDEALRSKFLQEAQLDGWLRTLGRSEAEGEAPVRRFLDGLNAEKDATGFIRKVQLRVKDAGTRRTRWRRIADAPGLKSYWIRGFVAAAALMIVVLLAAVTSRPRRVEPKVVPPPEEVVTNPPAQTPEPPRPPTRPRLEPPTEPQPLIVPPPRTPSPKPEEPPKPAPVTPPAPVIPVPEAPKAPEPPREKTRVAFAKLEGVRGTVSVVRTGASAPGKNLQDLSIGDRIVTGPKGSAAIAFIDSTRVEVDGEVELRAPSEQRGKVMFIERGVILAEVAKQPAALPMAFLSRHGEATVLGTQLKLTVDDLQMRLEVKEGKVRLTREGKSDVVGAGEVAEAKAGTPVVARRMGIDEILLLPKHVRTIKGSDWKLVDDEEAASGKAFEAFQRWNGLKNITMAEDKYKKGSLGFVEFVFNADAGKEYVLWIRGNCTATEGGVTEERFRFDFIAVEFVNAHVTCPRPPIPWNEKFWKYNGWAMKTGYNWIAGDADNAAPPDGQPMDKLPLSVTFAKAGAQVLRIYPVESPLRIDALWLSATQTKRPEADQKGPK